MGRFLINPISRLTCWYLVIVLTGLFALPSSAYSSFTSSPSQQLLIPDSEYMSGLRIDFEEVFILEDPATSSLSVDVILVSFNDLSVDESQILVASSSDDPVVIEVEEPYQEKVLTMQQLDRRTKRGSKKYKWRTLILIVLGAAIIYGNRDNLTVPYGIVALPFYLLTLSNE